MALYIVRSPEKKYAVFDDLELSFTRRGMIFAEAALLVMENRRCSADEAMSAVFVAGTGRAVRLSHSRHGTDGLSLDEMLWAISLVRGDGALLIEVRKIGCPNHRPGSPENSMSEEMAELCEAYGVPVPAATLHQRRGEINSLGGRLVSEWLAQARRPLPKRRRELRVGGDEEDAGRQHPMPQSG
jgi:hypothetical protein